MTTEYRVLGKRPVRPDGIEKVTGHANYGADVKLPGMLYARYKTSPHAHAIIKKIDYSKALALPGVHAVVTGADFPNPDDSMVPSGPGTVMRRFLIGNFMAIDKVVFFGHPVAAVAAVDVHTAEDALDLIEVEYEVLPPILTAFDAIRPDAPIIHPQIRTQEPMGAIKGDADEEGMSDLGELGSSDSPSNVSNHLQSNLGDIDQGFAEADVVVEGEYHNGTAHQGYIEPHTGTVRWNPDGTLTVWSSSQGVFGAVRDPLGVILEMDPGQIHAIPMEIGGGFGGKLRVYCEPVAALLSKKSGGHPVQLTMTRSEVLQASGPAAGVRSWGRIGAKNDGTITAMQLRLMYEAGGFPGAPVGGGMNTAMASYDIKNVRIDGYDILVNRPRNAAYRAPGAPGAAFIVESLVDEMAERLGMEKMEFRLKNAAKEGTERPNGTKLGPNGNSQVMQTILESPHYRSEITGPLRGRGVGMGFWAAGSGMHSVNATLNRDGSISLNAAAVDIGGLRAVEAQVMAEVLGIDYAEVRPRYVDTDSIGFTGNTGGSGTGSGVSASVHKVAAQIKERVVERAAAIWTVNPEAVTYHVDTASLSTPATGDEPERTMTLKQLASRQQATGGFISGHADLGGATGSPTYGGHIVDVEVDPDTGKVTVLRYTCVQDVGFAMHPAYVEGQMEGGAVQGIGMALLEEYYYDDDGILRNGTLLDYRQPTTLDTPKIETTILEVPHPGHPYGVRGVGECSIVPPMGAIANALYDATGIRFHDLPANPRKILEALQSRQDLARVSRRLDFAARSSVW